MKAGNTQLLGFNELTPDHFATWHALRAANPALDSPYFHPSFAEAVHGSGQPVSVAVAHDSGGAIVALLPGHRRRGLLLPVGWPGADFQAPIAAPGQPAQPFDLLPTAIREAHFDHLLSPGPQFDAWILARHASPFLDVTGGMDGYLARASKSGKDNMGQARRRVAKVQRELGPVTFAADLVDESALAQVIALKRAQYAATGARDYFDAADRVDLMYRLLHTREPDFAGILSTVHVGERLLAAHFGIRSAGVLHWWFPVYDPELGHLAPGWILLRELVAASPALGVTRIDLGRGDDEYKRRAKTGESVVCRAVLTRSSTLRMVRQARHAVVQFARDSAVAPALRPLIRTLRNARSASTTTQPEVRP